MLTKPRKVIRKRKSSKFKMYDYNAGLLKEFGRYFLSFLTRKYYIINNEMDYRQEGEIVDRCFELYLKEHSDLSDCRSENFALFFQGLWQKDCLFDYDNDIVYGIYRGKLVYATLDELNEVLSMVHSKVLLIQMYSSQSSLKTLPMSIAKS